jgi:hypothetical protein
MVSFLSCVYPGAYHKKINFQKGFMCELRTLGLGLTKSSPTLHGPFILVLLVGSIGFKIWHTSWIVVGTPLSRATLQELLVFGCFLYKNCELPSMIGCSKLLYATLMWKSVRSFVCLMFSSFLILLLKHNVGSIDKTLAPQAKLSSQRLAWLSPTTNGFDPRTFFFEVPHGLHH